MSYRIEYLTRERPCPPKKGPGRISVLTALCFLVCLTLFGCCWPHGRAVLRKLLIPGDPAVTTAAMESFALELQNGAGLSSAFLHFCRQVISGAGIAFG